MYYRIVGVLSVFLGQVFGDALIECRENAFFALWNITAQIFYFFRMWRNNNEFYALYAVSALFFGFYELKQSSQEESSGNMPRSIRAFDLRTLYDFNKFVGRKFWEHASFHRSFQPTNPL